MLKRKRKQRDPFAVFEDGNACFIPASKSVSRAKILLCVFRYYVTWQKVPDKKHLESLNEVIADID